MIQMFKLIISPTNHETLEANSSSVGQETDLFNVYGSAHLNYFLIYIQQGSTLHSLLYLGTALHVSGGTSTHHQERKQLYLQRQRQIAVTV
jgi:hypothetical protein